VKSSHWCKWPGRLRGSSAEVSRIIRKSPSSLHALHAPERPRPPLFHATMDRGSSPSCACGVDKVWAMCGGVNMCGGVDGPDVREHARRCSTRPWTEGARPPGACGVDKVWKNVWRCEHVWRCGWSPDVREHAAVVPRDRRPRGAHPPGSEERCGRRMELCECYPCPHPTPHPPWGVDHTRSTQRTAMYVSSSSIADRNLAARRAAPTHGLWSPVARP
jgi:hypothetical protein